jgi:hypothetical protein
LQVAGRLRDAMSISLSLVAALFGQSGGTTATGGDPASALAVLTRATAEGAEAKGLERERKDPVTIGALARFDRALAQAKDLDAALRDPRILDVLLPAFGLADQTGNAGLARKALLSNPAEAGGLLASLDSRWRAAASTLDLAKKGLEGLRETQTVATLKEGFLRYQYRSGLDETQPGLSDALYFLESAKDADDVYDILGNPVLRRVVTGALGLPDSIAVQSVETQGRAVTSRLDLSSLDDPKQVQKLAQRYLMAAAGSAPANAGGASSADPIASLYSLSVRI